MDSDDPVLELDRVVVVLLYILYERKMKDRKILITGASGFIGGFLVEEALRRRVSVRVAVKRICKISGFISST